MDSDKKDSKLSSDNSINPVYQVSTFKRLVSELHDFTETVFSHSKARAGGLRMSKERYQSAKDYLNAFENTMMAYQEGNQLGRLSNEQQREILVMVDDLIKGKHEAVQFQITRSGNAIREVFTSKVFELQPHHKKQDK